ncbi:uncharacterized protein LOC120990016 isoform X1 [Bufo bufo]|uniref:uncharacterized protein LOC120990016 isoform X1 n=1 Tax=Bufo bufo TaxID=8384 RepID=UPI001ABE87CF|nr:uncharacterized protein LOC120990016 isoform X1 [Bufo bufo]
MAKYSLYHNANFQSFVRFNYPSKPAKEKYDEIRVEAQLQHIHEGRRKEKSATAYAGDYRKKELDENCRSLIRPSSPTRMNKPHPPEVFLVTTLHNIPGHYKCKEKISSEGKGKAKNVTSSPSRPRKGHYGDKSQVHVFSDVSSNVAAQAWLRLANSEDYSAVKKMIQFVNDKQAMKEDTSAMKSTLYQVLKQYMKPKYLPSAQRWLLNARPEETKAVERLLWTLSTGPQTGDLKETSGTCSTVYRPQRTEYLIHPDWRSQS